MSTFANTCPSPMSRGIDICEAWRMWQGLPISDNAALWLAPESFTLGLLQCPMYIVQGGPPNMRLFTRPSFSLKRYRPFCLNLRRTFQTCLVTLFSFAPREIRRINTRHGICQPFPLHVHSSRTWPLSGESRPSSPFPALSSYSLEAKGEKSSALNTTKFIHTWHSSILHTYIQYDNKLSSPKQQKRMVLSQPTNLFLSNWHGRHYNFPFKVPRYSIR